MRNISLLLSFVLLSLYSHSLTAVKLGGRIVANPVLPSLALLAKDRFKVVINNGQDTAYLDQDGFFEFDHLPIGTHIMQFISIDYHFDMYRVDVTSTSVSVYLTLPGTTFERRGPLQNLPLEVSPRAKVDYFMPREAFSIYSLFANPMLLLSGFSLLMMFVLPKMTAAMDPQDLEDAKKSMPPALASFMPASGSDSKKIKK